MNSLPVVRDFFPRRINQYTPKMQMAADVHRSNIINVSLGAPTLPDVDGILNGVNTTAVTGSITVTGNALLGVVGATADSPYGRNVVMTGGGSGSKVITVAGFDYLGQPMLETMTASTGTATGLKAFYEVTRIDLGAVAGDSDTDFGWGAELGLPYVTLAIDHELEDNVLASAGTLTAPVLTDPQTATTGDPRGTYAPTGTLDGTASFTVMARVQAVFSASGNGGLEGIAHYIA